MKASEIKLGETYLAKVSDKVVPVRLDAEHPGGKGWDATNLATNKKVRIKSAQRLRPRIAKAPARDASQRTKAVAEARAADAAANAHAVPTEVTPAKVKKAKEPKEKKASGLDAAFEVLKAAKEPMRCKDMVDTMLAKGMWATEGKTPAATIYAAILREITTKGGEARFKKTNRGLFVANV